MMNRIYYILFGSFLILLGCTEEAIDLEGTGTITGTVVQDITFENLANVKISTNPSSNTVFTDAEGKFTLEVESGTYAVKAEKDGFLVDFESADVEIDEETSVVFELQISTANNKPPPSPTLITPEDDSINVPVDVTFEWESMDVDGDSLVYTIELRNANENTVETFENLDTNEFQTTLEFQTTYFWQITADDGINPAVLSGLNSFTTVDFPNNSYHFVRNMGNNYVIFSSDDDENEVQLTQSNTNSWRPRVNRIVGKIAFLRNVGANAQVFTMNLDGSNAKQITSSVPVSGFNLDEIDISWSDNGSFIYYPSQDKLYRIGADGSGNTLIYQTNDGNLITEVDFNNGIIAVKTNNLDGYNVRIFTIDENGQELSTVLAGRQGAAGGLQLSIDNRRLIYSRDVSGFESSSYRQLDSRVFVFDFSSSSNTQFTTNKPGGTNDLDPRFSPTDAQVILTNRPNNSNTSGTVQVLNPEIAEPRQGLFNNAFMPDWE
ncbi:Carboxypeptidase regulatory-like domain-containing protein [Nonlabens sp. Hel1_33_55]|uniref:carboxypeptidase-like regulatory domain-containing protein n=1 Tax=Nonlabens sp. Hel1_33_55 TaxID=1336802 RepID=UPI000875DEF8|nr:carboxypeptidase-like regulatory domain-containing protein [Nonlabens sp. Hel1_33_55]SCX97845.1 Carboxypeptidase regulatory-like domain-containing protein [Nonlabens sp. Hel1_33_55]